MMKKDLETAAEVLRMMLPVLPEDLLQKEAGTALSGGQLGRPLAQARNPAAISLRHLKLM